MRSQGRDVGPRPSATSRSSAGGTGASLASRPRGQAGDVLSGRPWQERWLQRLYDPTRGFVDGTTELLGLCASVMPEGARVLEVGAGATNAFSTRLAERVELHGTDPNPAVLTNTALADARVMEGGRLPFEDARFAACASSWVVEHLEDPALHLAEVHRVLEPGGAYVLRAPNLLHYVALASRLTPHALHERLVPRLTARPPGAPGPWPTFYRLNTPRSLRRRAAEAGLALEALHHVEKEPSYGMSSRALFLLGVGYERLVNSAGLLAPLRSSLQAVLRKAR